MQPIRIFVIKHHSYYQKVEKLKRIQYTSQPQQSRGPVLQHSGKTELVRQMASANSEIPDRLISCHVI